MKIKALTEGTCMQLKIYKYGGNLRFALNAKDFDKKIITELRQEQDVKHYNLIFCKTWILNKYIYENSGPIATVYLPDKFTYLVRAENSHKTEPYLCKITGKELADIFNNGVKPSITKKQINPHFTKEVNMEVLEKIKCKKCGVKTDRWMGMGLSKGNRLCVPCHDKIHNDPKNRLTEYDMCLVPGRTFADDI